MADVITLKDGSVETLLQSKDFEFLVEKYMGCDSADYFKREIKELQEKADEVYDPDNYLLSLESNTSCFQEILEAMEEAKSILEAPRVNKKKLFNLIEHVEKIINNQI